MNDFALCSQVMEPDGDCRFCRRNPANTKPDDNQTWIEPDYLYRSMGNNDCMDFVDNDESEDGWLCQCGHYEESGLHCSECGAQPPWGCDCSFCTDRYREKYGFDDDEF